MDYLRVKRDGYAICFVKHPSDKLKLVAVRQNGFALQFMEETTRDIRMTAIAQNPFAIEHIEYPSIDEVLLACRLNPRSLLYTRNLTPHMELRVVEADWRFIEHIREPNTDMILEMVLQLSK